MAFTDPAACAVLSRLGSGWELLSTNPEAPDMGWDVINCVLIKDYGATVVTALDVLAEWPIGKRPIPGKNFWTVRRQPQRVGGNVWQIQIMAHGDAGGRPLKYRIRSSTSTLTFSPAGLGPPWTSTYFTAAQANIKESSPILEVNYILIGQLPPSDKLGRPGAEFQTPPVNIPVAPPPWTYLEEWSYNLPDGWNFDDMDADVLAGTDTPVSLITATWTHQHLIRPKS